MTDERSILEAVRVPQQVGPDGMPARRPFTPELYRFLDPFLYCAHFGPRDVRETGWGFPPHPHRGFETVTYMLDGWLEHRDSDGAHAILEPGDVQWMTAGSGIVHSEMPPAEFRRRGGIVEGLQIWLNLPLDAKRVAPGFQMLRGAEMPVIERDGASVRVIAGSIDGKASPVRTQAPLILVHALLAPGAETLLPAPVGHGAATYVIRGTEAGLLTVYADDGDTVRIGNTTDAPADILLLSGKRLPQPVAAHGPFVMNSREEIVEAIEDYQAGRMGVVAG